MFMSGLFSLDRWDSDAEYLILDDFDWKWLPNKKQLLGGQREFTLTDKYKGKRTVLWSKPTILCINPEQYVLMMLDDMKEWLNDRCIFVHLTNKLF